MAVRIRLRRVGRKRQPHYRLVVADAAAPREGRVIETLGYYQPLSRPARLVLNLERVDYWLGQGATVSTTAHSLINKARKGGDRAVAVGEAEPQPRGTEGSIVRARTPAAVAAEAGPAAESATGEGGEGGEAAAGAEGIAGAGPTDASRPEAPADAGAMAAAEDAGSAKESAGE